MKLRSKSIYFPRDALTLEQTVELMLTPAPYSYGGKLEELEERINLQRDFLVRLVQELVSMIEDDDKSEVVTRLLGDMYETEL